MSIVDDQLTRWHPKFKVDEVPTIEPATLPAPPDVRKLHTAREVLDESKGKLNHRVKAALEKVASAKETKEDDAPKGKAVGTLSKEEKKATNNSPKAALATVSKSGSGMQSLLEKVHIILLLSQYMPESYLGMKYTFMKRSRSI